MNVLLVISGPAGSGKNTVAERLISEMDGKIERVVTSTSRPPRGDEKNGIDYNFFSKQGFEDAILNGEFYEYAKVHDNYYGTSKTAVKDAFGRGKDLILIIDVQGADSWRKIASADPYIRERLHSVFIKPPSIDELRKRLKNRGTDSQSDIDKRMLTALSELERENEFDFVINSSSKDEDFNALKNYYLSLKH